MNGFRVGDLVYSKVALNSTNPIKENVGLITRKKVIANTDALLGKVARG
jgi:hypothetical protein